MKSVRVKEGRDIAAEPALPEAFEDLALFVDWALEPERARTEKKVAASMDDIRTF